MIEGGGLGSFKPTDIGPIDVQSNNGTGDIVADDEVHAASIALNVLELLSALNTINNKSNPSK